MTRSSTFGGGKPVHAFLEYGGGNGVLPGVGGREGVPAADLHARSDRPASYEVFLRGTFDWIGTYPDFLHVGDYKTAVNTFTEKTSRRRTRR